MHTDDIATPDLDIPFVDLDVPFQELMLADLANIDEVLKTSQVKLAPPPTAGQTTYSDRISIRIPRWVLVELKKRAAAEGVRYQTFINFLLAQHAANSFTK